MNRNPNALNDEQLADLLACAPGTEAVERADNAELNELRAAVRSYRTETLLFAERRAAGLPSLAAAARRADRWAAAPRWALACVAVVTVAVGVAHFTGTDLPRDSEAAGVAASAGVAATVHEHSGTAQIEADNRLLNSIDAELSYHAVSPDEYGLKPAAHSETRRADSTEVRD